MAIIQQTSLFSWENFLSETGDLQRLQMALENMGDEPLMQLFEKERGKGRDDYPIRPMWNSFIARFVLQHDSIESLRRELQRNPLLRQICGFDLHLGIKAVPPSYVYSRFLQSLNKHQEHIDEILCNLVDQLKEHLPDLGQNLAVDSDAIESKANTYSKHAQKDPSSVDRRTECDADFGKKEYHGQTEEGKPYTKVTSWFGYKAHLIVDTKYELPLAYLVTKASANDGKTLETWLPKLHERKILLRGRILAADKGYDSTKLISDLWQKYGIHAVIDIRNMWKKNADPTQALPHQPDVVYNYKGDIFCFNKESDRLEEMVFCGYEKDRDTLKYMTPHAYYKFEEPSPYDCPSTIRIPLKTNERVFTSVARSSYKWKRLYKTRTAVERVNNRLDKVFKIDHIHVRGMPEIRLYISMGLCVMLAMALGRILNGQPELLRSLVKAA